MTRAAVSLLMVLIVPDVELLRISTAASAQVVVLSVAVCLVDCWRHNERALIRNLGVSLPVVAGVFAGAAVLGEVFLWVLGRINA